MLLEHTTARVTTVSRRKPGDTDQPAGRLRHVSMNLSGGETLTTTVGSITVNLTEVTPFSLARQVVGSGGWFLETSATSGYLDGMISAMSGITGPGTAVLCVGTAPGMTNLMAAEIMDAAPTTSQIDIGVEMGMGRHYGVAATEWFLRTAGQSYPVFVDHRLRQMNPGELKRRFHFTKGRSRPSIGYGFAEQSLIADRSLHRLKTVRSFVALDPAWMTRGLGLMLSLGLGPLISRHTSTLAKALRRLPTIGPSHCRLVVQGFDDAGQSTGLIGLETGDQADATAAMIFAMIQSVLRAPEPAKEGLSMITDHLKFDVAAANLRRFLPQTQIIAGYGQNCGNQPGLAASRGSISDRPQALR